MPRPCCFTGVTRVLAAADQTVPLLYLTLAAGAGRSARKATGVKTTLLRCSISPGQFTAEFAVGGTLHDGTGFSLFAEDADVEMPTAVSSGTPVSGWLRVDVLHEHGDLVLSRLPQLTLENGRVVTVRRDQLRSAKCRQPA